MVNRVYMYPPGHSGVGLYNYKLANALAGEGLDVTLFCDDRYELDFLPARFRKSRVLSSKYKLEGKIGAAGRFLRIVFTHLYNARKFCLYVRRERPNVAHLHSFFFYPVEWLALGSLRKTGVKIVLTVHNVLPTKYYISTFPRLERKILQYVYNMADVLIVHTDANRRQLLENFKVEESKVIVVPHGTYSPECISRRVPREVARHRLGIRREGKVVLFFGYIKRVKGIGVLLEAFDAVAGRVADAVLVIAGAEIEGESFGEYRHILRRMKYRSRVRTSVGYVEHADVPKFFEAADIVVLPYVEFYGQSGVLSLAQGFGKAVVVSDVGGLSEAVQNLETGIVVPAGDAVRLAEGMEVLLKNAKLREEMGQRGKRKAMEERSWSEVARITVGTAYN